MTPSPAPGEETIVAVSSGRPPAAVAVIRTSGPHAVAMLRAVTGGCRLPPPRTATLRSLSEPSSGEPIDQALVLRFPAPASATGEDIVEYQCHGGRAVVERLISVLTGLEGARSAEPGEFTRRALGNGRIDLTEAEGLADLLEAETEAQRRAALQLAEGGLRRQTQLWREELIALSAVAEAAIDYVGDEDETALDERALVTAAQALADHIAGWLARPRAERLKEGVRIVAAGPPNAGKSSLVNALSGSERAIVTDLPGTTRDVIEVPLAFEGMPLVLVDTAGLRDSEEPIERIGVERAGSEIERADIILWLGEPEAAPGPAALLVHPRMDVPGRERIPEGAVGVSSVTGEGLAELWTALRARLRGLLPQPGAIALNHRQAACLSDAVAALRGSISSADLAITANQLRLARDAFDRLTGHAGVEDVLDDLFGRFCLGK